MIRVGILGATGAVGQTFVRLLDGHPTFEVVALGASERSAGKPYREACNWTQDQPMPDWASGEIVTACAPEAMDVDLVFSGLDAGVAGEIEKAFAGAGVAVVSNARNHRMDADVPLLIPEINPDHLALVERQTWPEGGMIVTNPNCSTVGLVMALAPLHEAFGVEAVHVVTLQALSGAGYPGVPSLDILGNVVPYIGGEEAKMASEPLKILGGLSASGVEPAEMTISAQCTRVPVIDGHTECVSVRLAGAPSAAEVEQVLREWRSPLAGRGLHTAPEAAIQIVDGTGPQPRRHASAGNGMTVSIGQIQDCPVLGVKFVVLSHNTVRGAAGGALLNAELMVERGLVRQRP
ncbi:aspartate-semialdehyde dehydrogenase [Rubricoccus marinus]|uniref:aspartate-semialdehyde dehydrogenase n=1 Tax=Rubricoccus marinus TaxID=716817 RepID=A0A259TXM2_9BACT|nr:aspartate-semialdehyde dehydrogenase [Rubricoccus marinus]OZC02525.1 aspartate-semialdehyde dehydrogenase [Rubricoccus marinus]